MEEDRLNHIAKLERAIRSKYGDEAIENPKKHWDDNKEKEYINQLKEFFKKTSKPSRSDEKIEYNGFLIPSKLVNRRKELRNCSICGKRVKTSMDDVCFIKFDACNKCYVDFIEYREERWSQGWRPELSEVKHESKS